MNYVIATAAVIGVMGFLFACVVFEEFGRLVANILFGATLILGTVALIYGLAQVIK